MNSKTLSVVICAFVTLASLSLNAKKPPTDGPENPPPPPPPPPVVRDCRNLPDGATTPRYRWCEEESKYELIHLETGEVDVFSKSSLHAKLDLEQTAWFDVHTDEIEHLRDSAQTELWLHIPDQPTRPARFRTVVSTNELDFVFRHSNANFSDWENDVTRLGIISSSNDYSTSSGYAPSTLLLRTAFATSAEDLDFKFQDYPVFVREALSSRDFILDVALFREEELIEELKADRCTRGVIQSLDLDPILEPVGSKVKLFERSGQRPNRPQSTSPLRAPRRQTLRPLLASCES